MKSYFRNLIIPFNFKLYSQKIYYIECKYTDFRNKLLIKLKSLDIKRN